MPEEKLVGFVSLVVVSLIWSLRKNRAAIYFIVRISIKNYFQYISSLPDENKMEADGYENEAGVLVLGQLRVTGVTPIAPCFPV